MTARQFQDALPQGVAAVHVAGRAGIKPDTWRKMVLRGQVLGHAHRRALAGACRQLATAVNTVGVDVGAPE